MLGLDHHYLKGDEPGWENNVMGSIDGQDGVTGAGNVEQRNIDEVLGQFMSNYENSRKLAFAFNLIGIKTKVPGTDFEYKTKIDPKP